MNIVIGSDHRRFAIKQRLVKLLEQLGHNVKAPCSHSSESTDYPDYSFAVARAVSNGGRRSEEGGGRWGHSNWQSGKGNARRDEQSSRGGGRPGRGDGARREEPPAQRRQCSVPGG